MSNLLLNTRQAFSAAPLCAARTCECTPLRGAPGKLAKGKASSFFCLGAGGGRAMSVKSVLHSSFFAPSNAEASRVCELRSLASESRCADSHTMKPLGRAACCAILCTCQPTSAPRLGAAPTRPPPSPPARPLIPPAPRLATERCIVRAHAFQRPSAAERHQRTPPAMRGRPLRARAQASAGRQSLNS